MTLRGVRHRILATASAMALLLIVEGDASADPAPGTDRFWLSLTGDYLMYGGDSANYSASPTLPLSLKPRHGLGGEVELGFQPVDSLYSFVGRLKYTKLPMVSAHALINGKMGAV